MQAAPAATPPPRPPGLAAACWPCTAPSQPAMRQQQQHQQQQPQMNVPCGSVRRGGRRRGRWRVGRDPTCSTLALDNAHERSRRESACARWREPLSTTRRPVDAVNLHLRAIGTGSRLHAATLLRSRILVPRAPRALAGASALAGCGKSTGAHHSYMQVVLIRCASEDTSAG